MTVKEQKMHECIENDFRYFTENKRNGMTDPRAISLTYEHLACMASNFGWTDYDMKEYVRLAKARGIEIH